jgi:hypothetical protein
VFLLYRITASKSTFFYKYLLFRVHFRAGGKKRGLSHYLEKEEMRQPFCCLNSIRRPFSPLAEEPV